MQITATRYRFDYTASSAIGSIVTFWKTFAIPGRI
jgi:hypothetical protein